MSRTISDLSTEVLRHLSVIDSAESASSTDATYVQGIWRSKWEELSAHGQELTYFPYDDLPEAVFLIIRDIVANEVAGAYGQPKPIVEKEAAEQALVRKLRRHVATQSINLPTRALYY
jgi:hypothetical protein